MKFFWVLATIFFLFPPLASFADSLSPDLQFLQQLVSISSGTADIAGVNEVQKQVASKLKEMGFTPRFIENPDASFHSGHLLVAELIRNDSHPARFLTFVTHADTVFEKLNPFALSADGKIAHGSGVVDNKGGIVVGLAALRDFLKTDAGAHGKLSLRFVVSPAEETGSNGFRETLQSFAPDSVFLIGLEPGLDNGNYVKSRKGVRWYDIKITGKEAHAGAHHDLGINACYDLAAKIAQIQELTDYQKGTTVSIGHLDGGKDKFNIICGEAEAKIDTRFATVAEEKKLSEKIAAILKSPRARSAKTGEVTTVVVTNPVGAPPLPESVKARELLKQYAAIVQKMENRTIIGEASGGVADLNQTALPDSLIADGMGPVGGGMHTNEEFLTIDSLRTRSQALSEFIAWIDQKQKEKRSQ